MSNIDKSIWFYDQYKDKIRLLRTDNEKGRERGTQEG